MSYYLPLFPLNLVAFPQEKLNLHIFEPRYKDLVNDCWEAQQHFGIPAYIASKIEFGTEMKILEIFKRYQDGRMDIKTLGVKIFKVEHFANPWPDKKYAGGEVKPLEDIQDHVPNKTHLMDLLGELYAKLDIADDVLYDIETPAFQLAHKVGLSLEQEYRLMQMSRESERVAFMIKHLRILIPKLARAEKLRQRIKMNGHFKQLDSLDF